MSTLGCLFPSSAFRWPQETVQITFMVSGGELLIGLRGLLGMSKDNTHILYTHKVVIVPFGLCVFGQFSHSVVISCAAN